MKKISEDELKLLQVEILKVVRDFCKKNGLQYFLAYGTLLGAIRHKGYIPWDDDIDIMMPRKDYMSFLESFNGYNEDYIVKAPEIDPNYYAPYANVCDIRTKLIESHLSHCDIDLGVKIDIFPVDYVPSGEKEYKKICKESARLNNMRGVKLSNVSNYQGISKLKLFLKKFLFSKYTFAEIQNKIIDVCKQSNKMSDKKMSDVISFITIPNRKFPSEVLCESVDVLFEHDFFRAPKDYDTFLKCIFGDYMKLPPIEKRVTHHDFIAYWK